MLPRNLFPAVDKCSKILIYFVVLEGQFGHVAITQINGKDEVKEDPKYPESDSGVKVLTAQKRKKFYIFIEITESISTCLGLQNNYDF